MDQAAAAGSGVGLALFVIGFIVFFYLLPTFIAMKRKMANAGLLCFVNIILGWTMLIWVVCLLWAALGQSKRQREFYESAGRR